MMLGREMLVVVWGSTTSMGIETAATSAVDPWGCRLVHGRMPVHRRHRIRVIRWWTRRLSVWIMRRRGVRRWGMIV